VGQASPEKRRRPQLTATGYICEGCGNDLPRDEGKALVARGWLLCAECREQALTVLEERQKDLVAGPGRYLRNDDRQAQRTRRPF
jgi:hypothetical protein